MIFEAVVGSDFYGEKKTTTGSYKSTKWKKTKTGKKNTYEFPAKRNIAPILEYEKTRRKKRLRT